MNNTSNHTGISLMILGSLICGLCFVGAFIHEDTLSLGLQVTCHIGFLISPLAIKLGYVFKLITQNQTLKAIANA
jgi:hypothetical protein